MMKSVVILTCLVAVICAAEVDFLRRRSSVVVGKPMQVPVFPPKRNVNQQKRQVDFDAGTRAGSAGASARQQSAGVPLQQAFRSPHPTEFRRPQQQRTQQERAQPERPQPEQETDAATRAGAPSSFASAAAPEQTFSPARDNVERPVERPIDRPARQQPVQRPARPAASSFGAERPQKNPEFAGGFPSGFTSGLPSFDFQGRMPEPDAKSEGFMETALNDFPNLKTLGGFDAFPDVAREGDSSAKRPAQNRPARPSSQKNKRATPRGNLTKNPLPKNLSKRNKNKPIIIEDDEAMLEPDYSSIKRSSKQPTDIADIIADSVGEEQRFSPAFHPNNGPYGRSPPPAPANPAPVSTSSFRARRPSSISSSSANKNNRQNQRSPYVADQFNEFVDGENGLLGSGNFDVLGGGVFRDTVEYQRPYVASQPQYFPPSSPAPPQDTFRPHQPFFQSVQQSPPIGDQFGNFVPPLKQSVHQQQGPPLNNNNYGNVPNFPSSFFNDDNFFSNFRDFADVNQDYRS